MKIIDSYNDITLDAKSKKIIYGHLHLGQNIERIEKLLPAGKSVWIDSNGDTSKSEIVAFENEKWKDVFETNKPIKFYKTFLSDVMVNAIQKYIQPTSIVLYESEEIKYLNTQQLIEKINYIVKCFHCKVIVYFDLLFTDFNKLKYPYDHIATQIKNNITANNILHNIDHFRYIIEVDR